MTPQKCYCLVCKFRAFLGRGKPPINHPHAFYSAFESRGHRQWASPIPKRLRIYFRYDRTLLGKLCRAAWETIRHVYALEIDSEYGIPAMVAVNILRHCGLWKDAPPKPKTGPPVPDDLEGFEQPSPDYELSPSVLLRKEHALGATKL